MASRQILNYFASKYQANYCKRLINHCATGRTIESFASEIDSIPDVFPIWMKLHEQFEIAMHVAYWKSLAFWEDQLISDQTKTFREKTLTPAIFNAVMKHRFKWDTTNEKDIAKAISELTDEELEHRCRIILETREKKVQALTVVHDEEFDEND